MDGPASSRMKMQLNAHPVFYGSGSDGNWEADDHMLKSYGSCIAQAKGLRHATLALT